MTIRSEDVPELITAFDADLILAAIVDSHTRDRSSLAAAETRGCSVSVTAKLVAVDTAEIVASIAVQKDGLALSQAVACSDAAEDAARTLADQIIETARSGAIDARRIEVTLLDLPDWWSLDAISAAIGAISGVKRVHIATAAKGATELSVSIDKNGPSAMDLASAIGRASPELIVESSSARTIRARFRKSSR